MNSKKKVVIAGARGFIGQALIAALADSFEIIGLSRRSQDSDDGVEWRACDLFSRAQTEEALRGAEVAVYLVHSMLPSARLTQGDFEDMDLICADNFARGARANGVQHIVYLGGILPTGTGVSRHLESRHEVEIALGAYGTPVTSLRAGLIVGPNGSSTAIVVRLVKKLPVMLCPAWTRMNTQPIALQDVIHLLKFCLENPEQTKNQAFDIGGKELMTYKGMMAQTARIMGVKRLMMDVPFDSPRISTGWVSAFTEAPLELVAPLIESLQHSMVAEDDRLLELASLKPTPFEVSMREAVEFEFKKSKNPVAFDKKGSRNAEESTVRSVQRLPLPHGRHATWVAEEYARWLPDFLAPLMRVKVKDRMTCFYVKGIARPLLELELAEISAEDRQVFWIRGGLLAHPNPKGRLEFREVLGGHATLAAIHDFRPKLPWYLYRYSQALAHLFVMHGFSEHLAESRAESVTG